MQKVLETITKEREARGWTEYVLAERAGLPQSTISSWHCKHATPSMASLNKICSALGITLSQLFADGDDAVTLTASEKKLLNVWTRLSEEQQAAVFALIEKM